MLSLIRTWKSASEGFDGMERWGSVAPSAGDVAWQELTAFVSHICTGIDSPPCPQRREPLTDEQSRSAFEQFVKDEMGDIAVMDAGRYISPKIQNYWRVWQFAHGIKSQP
jgi:hypothetical protein